MATWLLGTIAAGRDFNDDRNGGGSSYGES